MHLPKELPRYPSYQQYQRHGSVQDRGKNIVREVGEGQGDGEEEG